jgi:hypothetical protein
MHKELQTNLINSMRLMFADSNALVANRLPSTIGIVQEIIQATNEQVLDSKEEIKLLKGQLGR